MFAIFSSLFPFSYRYIFVQLSKPDDDCWKRGPCLLYFHLYFHFHIVISSFNYLSPMMIVGNVAHFALFSSLFPFSYCYIFVQLSKPDDDCWKRGPCLLYFHLYFHFHIVISSFNYLSPMMIVGNVAHVCYIFISISIFISLYLRSII